MIAFYIAMILPSYCFASARSFDVQVRERISQREEGMKLISFSAPVMNEELLRDLGLIASDARPVINARFEDSLIIGQRLIPITVFGENSHNMDGQDDKNFDCDISDALAEESHLKAGETVYIRQMKLTIRNVRKTADRSYNIWLPYEQMGVMYPNYYIQQDVIGASLEMDAIKSTLLAKIPDATIHGIWDADDMNDDTILFLTAMVGTRFIVGIMATVIGILNIYLILYSDMISRKYEFGIHLACGGAPWNVFIRMIYNHCAEMVMAAVMLAITMHGIYKLLGLEGETKVDAVSVGGTIGFAFALMIIVTMIMTIWIIRQPAAKLLVDRG